jgi:hypothetical protein
VCLSGCSSYFIPSSSFSLFLFLPLSFFLLFQLILSFSSPSYSFYVIFHSPFPLIFLFLLIFISFLVHLLPLKLKTKLRGFSPQANYTDRAIAACRGSKCQLLWLECVAWSAQRIPPAVNLGFLDSEPLLFHWSSSSVILTRLSGPRSRTTSLPILTPPIHPARLRGPLLQPTRQTLNGYSDQNPTRGLIPKDAFLSLPLQEYWLYLWTFLGLGFLPEKLSVAQLAKNISPISSNTIDLPWDRGRNRAAARLANVAGWSQLNHYMIDPDTSVWRVSESVKYTKLCT